MTTFDPDAIPNLEAIRLWVQALRSDEFTQGHGGLTAFLIELDTQGDDAEYTWTRLGGDRDCCLGVACKIAIRNGVDLTVKENVSVDYSEVRVSYDRESAFLPEKVRQWLGVPDRNPMLEVVNLDGDVVRHCASGLNDGETEFDCFSYSDIADAIERTYLPGERS